MESNEIISQEMDMCAGVTQGTANSPPVGTALPHKESQATKPNEEEKGAEDASTLSSWGASAVQGPQPEGSKQWGLSPTESHHH
jgi:hypothetical protein